MAVNSHLSRVAECRRDAVSHTGIARYSDDEWNIPVLAPSPCGEEEYGTQWVFNEGGTAGEARPFCGAGFCLPANTLLDSRERRET